MTPLMWALAALMAGSTGASMAAQRKVNKSRTNVMAEERERRQIQQQKADAAARSTADTYAQTAENQKLRAAEVEQATRAPEVALERTPEGTSFNPLAAPVGSTATVDDLRSQLASGREEFNKKNAALARLSSFGDVMADNSLGAARNAQDIGQAHGFTQGWQQNVLPALLARANSSGRDWATAADVMKLAATVMTPFALGQSASSQAAQQAGENAAAAVNSAPASMFDAYKLPGLQPGAWAPRVPLLPNNIGSLVNASMGGAGGLTGLAGSDALSKAMWKQIHGMALSQAERQILLQGQMARP